MGGGIAGRSHLFDLLCCPGFEPVAVCTTSVGSATRVAREFGVGSAYSDVAAMIAQERMDGLVVAVPPGAGDRVLPVAAGCGLPLVIDKPGAASPAVLRNVLATYPGLTGRTVVSYNRRYQAHVRALRSLLADGSLGALQRVHCTWTGPFRDRYASGDTYRGSVRFGGGVLLDTVCHVVDTLLFLGLGPLEVKRARLDRGSRPADVAAEVRLRGGGGRVSVTLSVGEGPEHWEIVVEGSAGRAHLVAAGLTVQTPAGARHVDGVDLGRPVEDLGRAERLGATVEEAEEVLRVLEHIRAAATARPWLPPRAKALGRLNGAC
ncbi:hypothetical protein GCM10017556_44030 [Micromonospora sagamiensis]|uniref:Putative dehydrogenase n=1 Tax=Micromonospora sagamiensis TaxID=47875 RepID=A0A562WJ71_9ACTN|nr:putative dehydrogenase [Micromonospora sagamiensis]BCL16664.1 hypothetical protein GCM10017556_44030 [Micromonospora sagamiensis]